MGEKTEKASPKKLRDARKKGQVAKSQDLPSAFTFIASISLILALSTYLYNQVGNFVKHAFSLVREGELERVIPKVFEEAITTIFITVIPILALVSLVGVVVNFLVVGPMFATEVFKFDIKKFDVVKNLKAKFKLKTLFELAKSIFKISVAAYIIYSVIYKSLPVLTKAATMPLIGALSIFYAFLLEVVVKVGLFFIGVAILDFAYQKYNFGKEMMMEKFEVKQEYKNTEGDPQIKGKRKQIAQEIAYSEGPAGGVQKAAAVVTNPTHLAIALGYDQEIDPAPYVLAKGEGIVAEQIIEIAKKFEVPIVRQVELTHELWGTTGVYELIPEDTYSAVAEILRWIRSFEEQEPYELDVTLAGTDHEHEIDL